jgi:hypothetical protein
VKSVGIFKLQRLVAQPRLRVDVRFRDPCVRQHCGFVGGWRTLCIVLSLPGWPTLCRSKGWAALLFPSRVSLIPVIHSQQSFPAIVVTPTAPWPIPGVHHQLRSHRIAVHILKLFHHFCAGMHIEVIISSLPEPTKRCRGFCEGERPLARLPTPPFTQAARNSLLEHLHNFRGIAGSRFADQQMHMFGHEHITD